MYLMKDTVIEAEYRLVRLAALGVVLTWINVLARVQI
jgi:hypothetical protein